MTTNRLIVVACRYMETYPAFFPVESPDFSLHQPSAMSTINAVNAARRSQANRPSGKPRDTIVFPREDITRDGKTFSLPKLDCITDISPPDAKRRFFEQTYDAINTGNGKPSTKVHTFCTRFTSGPPQFNAARNRLLPLYDYNTQIISLIHPMIFTFNDTRLQDDAGARVDFNIADAELNDNDLPDDETRADARFFGAILTIHGTQAHPDCTTASLELQIAFRLPIVDNVIAPLITVGCLRHPHELLAILAQLHHQEP